MRVLLILLLVPLSAAQGPLYLTAESLDDDNSIEGTRTFGMSLLQPAQGKAPMPGNAVLTGWSQHFEFTAEQNMTFDAPGHLELLIGCDTAAPGGTTPPFVNGVTAWLEIGNQSIDSHTTSFEFVCTGGEPVPVDVPLDAESHTLLAGETLGLDVSVSAANAPPPIDDVWLAVGTEGRSALNISWVPGNEDPSPRLEPVARNGTWDDFFAQSWSTTWTTDAENVSLELYGDIRGDVRVTIDNASEPGSPLYEATYQNWQNGQQQGPAAPFSMNTTLPAGRDTTWDVDIDMRGMAGDVHFALRPIVDDEPVPIPPASEASDPWDVEENATASPEPAPTEGKDSPAPWVIAPLAAAAWRRRRRV